jgi:hypothetical protein
MRGGAEISIRKEATVILPHERKLTVLIVCNTFRPNAV